MDILRSTKILQIPPEQRAVVCVGGSVLSEQLDNNILTNLGYYTREPNQFFFLLSSRRYAFLTVFVDVGCKAIWSDALRQIKKEVDMF